MEEHIPVLIVGAGPTGLTMAAALHHHGIRYRLIEKRAEPTQTSNAAVIHSRTMEMLDDLELIDPFIKQGQRIHSVSLSCGNENLATIPIDQIDSHYNFMLSIPQNMSEKIIIHHLKKIGHPVEREMALIDLEQEQDGLIATITNEKQKIQTIYCQYLIACDGAKSIVRELLNMEFSGVDIPQQFILVDASIPNTFPDDLFSIYLDPEGPLAVFPFNRGHARIMTTINDPNRDPKQPISQLEVQSIVEKRSAGALTVKESYWISSFWVHSKKLKHFQKNRTFFLGDAAHLHSPVGGQGMNTGMQDAYNLAWKLALRIHGLAKQNLVESYHEEREYNAKTLLTNTDFMTTMILVKNPVAQWFRLIAMRFFLRKNYIQRAFIMEISMLNLHYGRSSIINYEHHVSPKGPLPGHRAPDVRYHDNKKIKRLDDLLRTTKHTLLVFTGERASGPEISQIRAFERWVNTFNTLIHSIIIIHPNIEGDFLEHAIQDTHGDLHNAYHAHKPCFFMIRPDNYIGCCSAELDLQLLQNYWKHIIKIERVLEENS